MVSSCNRANAFPTAALSTSGIRVEGDSFLSACQNKLPCIFSCKIKTGETGCGFSCKKSLDDDFLRRHYPHQVKGSKLGYFLSACFTSSPVFISTISIHIILQKTSTGQHLSYPQDFYESKSRPEINSGRLGLTGFRSCGMRGAVRSSWEASAAEHRFHTWPRCCLHRCR